MKTLDGQPLNVSLLLLRSISYGVTLRPCQIRLLTPEFQQMILLTSTGVFSLMCEAVPNPIRIKVGPTFITGEESSGSFIKSGQEINILTGASALIRKL